MSALDLLLVTGCLAAVAGAVARNLTAIALLASFAFSEALCKLGVPFNFVLWVVIDLLVIICIIRPDMRHRELVVLALFLPIWALYIAWPQWGPQAIETLAAVQMLLTFPVRRAWAASRQWVARMRADDTGALMVAA